MSFGWLGTFRSGSWQELRKFLLHERRDVAQRISVITAELTRIGEVTVFYKSTEVDGVVTVNEEREGFDVSVGSNLEKLIRAYVGLGGNPFDISLFLSPTTTMILDDADPTKESPSQPYDGIVYPISAEYVSGQEYKGGYQVIKKYVPGRVGGRKELDDARAAELVALARKPFNKEIRYKRNDLEARIIKQCDLKEQLEQELEDLTMLLAGAVGPLPSLDEDQYSKSHSLVSIIHAFDSVFYAEGEDGLLQPGDRVAAIPGTTPPTYNDAKLKNKMHLLKDIENEELNTAL